MRTSRRGKQLLRNTARARRVCKQTLISRCCGVVKGLDIIAHLAERKIYEEKEEGKNNVY